MSIEKGCEGRMEVHATWGAGSFYEHCGFIGKEKGEPGIKYFDPTPENIEKLYKGGKRENLTFQKSKALDFGALYIEDLLEPTETVETTQQKETLPKTQTTKLQPALLHNILTKRR